MEKYGIYFGVAFLFTFTVSTVKLLSIPVLYIFSHIVQFAWEHTEGRTSIDNLTLGLGKCLIDTVNIWSGTYDKHNRLLKCSKKVLEMRENCADAVFDTDKACHTIKPFMKMEYRRNEWDDFIGFPYLVPNIRQAHWMKFLLVCVRYFNEETPT